MFQVSASSILLPWILMEFFGFIDTAIEFYSYSGSSYSKYSDFSQKESIRKFANELERRFKSNRNLSRTMTEKIQYANSEYCFQPSPQCSIEINPNKTRSCSMNWNRIIQEKIDLPLGNGSLQSTSLVWTCTVPSWCCGAECCSRYFNNPLRIAAFDIVSYIFAFAIVLIALFLARSCSQARKVFELIGCLPKRMRSSDESAAEIR